MSPETVVEEVKNKVLELVGAGHSAEVESLFDKIDELTAQLADKAEEAHEQGYEKGLAESTSPHLVEAVKEFAIWHGDSYHQTIGLAPDVVGGVSRQLWSRVVDAAGPSAGLPANFAGVLP